LGGAGINQVFLYNIFSSKILDSPVTLYKISENPASSKAKERLEKGKAIYTRFTLDQIFQKITSALKTKIL
jgi:hypothetical protein